MSGRSNVISPDIILLIGGTDGGDKKVILHNAAMLSGLPCRSPIVVAGNRDAVDEIEAIFAGSEKNVVFAANVMPEIGTLSVDSCREAIRRFFVSHIIKAKGIDRALALVDETIIPTPSAVLKAAVLLADGLGRGRRAWRADGGRCRRGNDGHLLGCERASHQGGRDVPRSPEPTRKGPWKATWACAITSMRLWRWERRGASSRKPAGRSESLLCRAVQAAGR